MRLSNKITFYCILALLFCVQTANSRQSRTPYKASIALKKPGNLSINHPLTFRQSPVNENSGEWETAQNLPVKILHERKSEQGKEKITITITALENLYFNYQMLIPTDFIHENCQFYMPGFWYRHNMRSPKEAPSFHTSDSWTVREDRLSAPLTGIYNQQSNNYITVARLGQLNKEALTTHKEGEIIVSGETSIGYTGFENTEGKASLSVGFPYHESPKTYVRKLTLAPSVTAFQYLKANEQIKLEWEIYKNKRDNFSDFVADIWNYSFDTYNPQPYELPMSTSDAKSYLTRYFTQSYVDKHPLKYFSGVHMYTADCANTGSVEVGFVGRVLLNAFNALEYGEENNRPDLINMGNNIFDSYLQYGFTTNGFIREFVNYDDHNETDIYSIRRQSEGVFAILNYLDYERKQGRKHPEWETKIVKVLDNFLKLQEKDGSFPRKFKDNFDITDSTGGSTPSATLPLTMAYKYFNNKKYLESAHKTAQYLETELISKADYFSSTLDANCEDKEASLYASTAMYYLSFVTKGNERKHYVDLCKKSAYFSLSWYYMWDVPFAQGQMLGDVNFKSRGWGNVSVENNHIDVFIFEFSTVLNFLSKEYNDTRFQDFSNVIRSSMLQLMPLKEHGMYDIAKDGYYPEVVQHTNWDYGKNGKGFYNDIFAPGWTVASLWQMLSPQRVEKYFK